MNCVPPERRALDTRRDEVQNYRIRIFTILSFSFRTKRESTHSKSRGTDKNAEDRERETERDRKRKREAPQQIDNNAKPPLLLQNSII